MSGDPVLDELLSRTAMGDRAAFVALYDRTSAKLFGICLRVLGNKRDAEDALQETYVKIWRNAQRYVQGPASAISWLATIARNQAIDHKRARKGGEVEIDEAIQVRDKRPSPEDMTGAAAERRLLMHCLEQLGEEQQKAVKAAFFGGHTYEELSQAMQVPLGTMKSWIRRSLQRLRACLEDAGQAT